MKISTVRNSLLIVLLSVCSAFGQGSLTPPGAPGATMKTLDQVEPRIDLATVPGNSSYYHVITNAGSYYLSENLVVTNSGGIAIYAPNVTLDLNGFTISLVSGSGTYGVLIEGIQAIVRNGHIKGFMIGVANSSAIYRGCLLKDVTVTQCTISGISLFGTGARIVDCTAYNNPGRGIYAGDGSSLSGCTASYNQGDYAIYAASGSTLSGCAASYNRGTAGIYANNGSTLSGCTASDNVVQYGIRAGDGSSLRGCTARSNEGTGSTSYGIFAERSVIVDCAAIGNTHTNLDVIYNQGVGIYTGDGGVVENCTAQWNDGDGILVGSDSFVSGNACGYNGHGGEGSGIHVTGSDNRIEDNNATDNTTRGFHVTNSGNIIVRNTASGNGTNWEVTLNNACLVVQVSSYAAISGDSGGAGLGSTNPHVNFTY